MLLEEVDDPHEVEEEPKAGAPNTAALSSSFDTLALLTSSQNVDMSGVGDHVREESWSDERDVLRHVHAVEGVDG